VSTAFGWPNAKQFRKGKRHCLLFGQSGLVSGARVATRLIPDRGGGLVYLHYAVDGHTNVNEIGRSHWFILARRRIQISTWSVGFANTCTPIGRWTTETQARDESYWQLVGDVKSIQVVASGVEEGKLQPLIWTREQGRGRVFGSIPAVTYLPRHRSRNLDALNVTYKLPIALVHELEFP